MSENKDKRKKMEIWEDIQRKIGINPDIYEESIHYANFTRKELLKLEKAINKFILFSQVK